MTTLTLNDNPPYAWGIENGFLIIGFDTDGVLELISRSTSNPDDILHAEDFVFDGDIHLYNMLSGLIVDMLKVRIIEDRIVMESNKDNPNADRINALTISLQIANKRVGEELDKVLTETINRRHGAVIKRRSPLFRNNPPGDYGR